MVLGSIEIGIGVIVLLVGAVFLALELQYRLRPGNVLELAAGEWHLEIYEPQRYLLVGEMDFINQNRYLEIMVPEIKAQVTLLSQASLAGISWKTRIGTQYPDAPARPDDYLFAYIVKMGKVARIQISIEIEGPDLNELQAAWIQVRYVTYGPEGRVPRVRHIVVPLKFPDASASSRWRPATNADVLPIRTHLLTHLDNPVEVVRRYVMPHAQPGDIVTIGESPVAIMQGRFRHPSQIRPGWVASRLCYLFMPTSSLATACGLQALVDIVGPTRVLLAFLGGALAKLVGIPGMFYRLAGPQARLIDDVTGTLPPYDQFIVLGPKNSQQVVDQIQQETGLGAAIVDVNDLKAVQILAATADVSHAFLKQALITNPAGNSDEQTPIVLIRPVEPNSRKST